MNYLCLLSFSRSAVVQAGGVGLKLLELLVVFEKSTFSAVLMPLCKVFMGGIERL